MFTVNRNPSVSDLHKFGRAMLIGFAALAMALWVVPFLKTWGRWDPSVLWWAARSGQITAVCFLGLGLLLFLTSLASPAISKPLYVTWMSIVVPIGIVMSTIMLSILFVVLLPLFSVVVRLGDPLRKKTMREAPTYWEDYKEYEPTLERMGRPF